MPTLVLAGVLVPVRPRDRVYQEGAFTFDDPSEPPISPARFGVPSRRSGLSPSSSS